MKVTEESRIAYIFGFKDDKVICTEAEMCRVFPPVSERDKGMFEFNIVDNDFEYRRKVGAERMGAIGNIHLDAETFGRFPMITFCDDEKIYKEALIDALYNENDKLAELQENAKIIGRIEAVSEYAVEITKNLSSIAEVTKSLNSKSKSYSMEM